MFRKFHPEHFVCRFVVRWKANLVPVPVVTTKKGQQSIIYLTCALFQLLPETAEQGNVQGAGGETVLPRVLWQTVWIKAAVTTAAELIPSQEQLQPKPKHQLYWDCQKHGFGQSCKRTSNKLWTIASLTNQYLAFSTALPKSWIALLFPFSQASAK